MSATGILVLQSHCACTGDKHVSVYVSPETCEDTYHEHHIHLAGGEEAPVTESNCHDCSTHKNECGCNNVSISFYKIKNEVVQEKVRSDTKLPVKSLPMEMIVFLTPLIPDGPTDEKLVYTEPPITERSLDFLIHIHQLKIAFPA